MILSDLTMCMDAAAQQTSNYSRSIKTTKIQKHESRIVRLSVTTFYNRMLSFMLYNLRQAKDPLMDLGDHQHFDVSVF